MTELSDESVSSTLECAKTKTIFNLDHSPFLIGRSRQADIDIKSIAIATTHCELTKDTAGKWFLNVKGATKTYINKKSLTVGETYPLTNGDILEIGNHNVKNMTLTFKTLQPPKKDLELKSENEKLRDEVEKLQKQVQASSLNNIEEILESELKCGVCNELFVTATTLNCSHTFCKFCINMWEQRVCPLCRAPIRSENRALALDNFLEKMMENVSEDLRTRRRVMIEERRWVEEARPTGVLDRRPNSGGVRFAVLREVIPFSPAVPVSRFSAALPTEAQQPRRRRGGLSVRRNPYLRVSTNPLSEVSVSFATRGRNRNQVEGQVVITLDGTE